MDIYKIYTPEELLKDNTYPGRGIIIGKTPDGTKAMTAYFIMGRSDNSRNRIFTEKNGEVFTEPFDAAKVQDPSLIIYAAIRAYENNLIVLAGFLSILTEDFTTLYARRIINVHPSLIPSFCGAGFYGLKVHEAALARGVKVTGATVHFVNEIPDGGEIIAQKAVEIQPGDTPEILQRRVMEQAEWVILPQSVEAISKEIVSGIHN